MSLLKLKKKQAYALDVLKKKFNVFLSGEAGTGKSFVIDQFTNYLDAMGIKYVVCAPTGLAALNIGGTTLHRTFKLSTDLNDDTVDLKNVEEAEVIIIDEISMCRRDIFQYIARALLKFENPIEEYSLKRESKICRKKQIVVVGDFYQLPPVIGNKDRENIEKMKQQDDELGTDFYKHITNLPDTSYAFQCEEWESLNFRSIVLDEVVRQSDKDYIDNLNKIRRGDAEGLEFIKNESHKEEIKNAIFLTSKNRDAENINQNNLDKIKGKEQIFYAEENGEVSESDKPVPKYLKFKIGARVMSVVNVTQKDKEETHTVVVNGMMGNIINLTSDSVTVRFDDGYVHKFEKYKWSIKGFEKVKVKDPLTGKENEKMVLAEVGYYRQIPLKLAWAITVHKSQGQTYEAVNLNPDCFCDGQLYVALSRAKDLKKLYLTQPISTKFLKTSMDVKEFYERIETGSAKKEYNESIDVEVQSVQQEESTSSTVGVQVVNNLEDVAIALDDTSSTIKELNPEEIIKDLQKTIDALNKEVSRLKYELEQAKSRHIDTTKEVSEPIIDNKPVANNNTKTDIDIEKVLRLKKHGLAVSHIARMCKTDVATINKALSKHNK